MLKLIISCGGGMSSSVLFSHIQEDIIKKGWEDKLQVSFVAFPIFMEKQDAYDADLILVCPHLRFFVQEENKKGSLTKPIYIIPALLYGSMNIEYLMEDALDLLEIHKNSQEKLLKFPEEKLLNTERKTSHRRWILKHLTQS